MKDYYIIFSHTYQLCLSLFFIQIQSIWNCWRTLKM